MKVVYDDLLAAIHAQDYRSLSDHDLALMTPRLKRRLSQGEDVFDVLPEAFAVVQEVSGRLLDKRHFDEQLLGGIALFEGHITEMKTGEGKTLTSLLPAYLHALQGHQVHIVTVNEYLAQRDREENRKVFNFLGLTVGVTLNGMSPEKKRDHYQKDIVYGVASEFGFDYLRNHTATSKDDLTLERMDYVLIDEVDSILIDEAKTPLILSGGRAEDPGLYAKAFQLIEDFKRQDVVLQTKFDRLSQGVTIDPEADFLVQQEQTVSLTDKGLQRMRDFFDLDTTAGGVDPGVYHIVKQSLHAKELLHKDEDYVVHHGEVQIVDPSTGRVMEGRRFKDGLHQALEAKEGVAVQGDSRTLASITLQNFFMSYTYLSGMTGTALTETKEFKDVYGKSVAEIPTHRSMIRMDYPDELYDTGAHKEAAIIKRLYDLMPQPVLIGVATVEQSERLHQTLKDAGFTNVAVLNANHHLDEAYIVAQAGRLGQITIATNMAGRGTDILLGGNPEYLAQDELRQQGAKPSQLAIISSPVLKIPQGYKNPAALYDLKFRYDRLVEAYRLITDKERDQVKALGGLFVLGTQRNEAQRVDNQLRGRAGRQGDPGASLFMVSLEDDWLDPFRPLMPKGKADRTGLLARGGRRNPYTFVDKMQAKLEDQGREARESLTEYDQVDAIIRENVYDFREAVLERAVVTNLLESLLKRGLPYYVDRHGDVMDPSFGLKQPGPGETLDSLLNQSIPRRMKLVEALAVFNNQSPQAAYKRLILETLDQEWEDLLVVLDSEKEAARMNYLGVEKPLHRYRGRVIGAYDTFLDHVSERLIPNFFHLPYQQSVLDYDQL